MVVAIAAVPAVAEGRGKAPAIWTIEGEPIAQVRGGIVRRARCAGWRGGEPGTTWTAVDFWGQPVGTSEVASAGAYDLTGCREVTFRVKNGRAGSGVHVLGLTPTPSFACGPQTRRAALTASLRAAANASAKARVDLFCTGAVVRGVVTGTSVAIAHFDRGAWIMDVVPQAGRAKTTPRLIADMNHDGAPEILVRHEDVDTYHDEIWSLGRHGWRIVLATPGSGYA